MSDHLDVGGEIRKARGATGQSITDIEKITRIPSQIIKDIENNSFESSGGTAYVRGNIRIIAKVLNLDSAALLSTFEKQTQEVFRVAKKNFIVGAAVPTSNGKSVVPRVESLIMSGAKAILVDTANGHSTFAVDTVREIRRRFPDIHIMAGNVATATGFVALALAGADSIRVGIGGGSCCTTRLVSGHGLPTLASIIDCYEMSTKLGLPTSIIADGGIKNSGDAVKAFAAGADAVMLGSLLAGHKESPGQIFEKDGVSYKKFRGMASKEAQHDWRGHSTGVEGIDTVIPYRGSVSNTLDELRVGIGSGCSYSGCGSLEDLVWNAEYTIVTPNSMNESVPHGKAR